METVDGVLPPSGEVAEALYAGPRYESPLGFGDSLNDEERELCTSFARDGFIILDDLALHDFDEVASQLRVDLDPTHASGFNRIQDAWTVSESAWRLATVPKVLRTLSTLYGRTPVPFQTLHFLRGSQQRTHSDAVHFHSVPRHFMCGVWIALEQVGANNGPLHYYPGSHTRPVLEYVDIGVDPSEPDAYMRYESSMAKLASAAGFEKRTIELEPGQAMIWAAGLWHGGEPIAIPESTRRTQVTHYLFEGCIHYAPRLRNFSRNRMGYLHYRDIQTGKWRRPSFEGRRVRLGVRETAQLTLKEVSYRLGIKPYMRSYR